MRKRFVTKKVFTMLLISLGLFQEPSYGQSTGGDTISALNSIRATIDGVVTAIGTYIFQAPPFVGNELASNYAQSLGVPTVPANVLTLNQNDISTGLAPDTSNPNLPLTQLATIQASDTVLQGSTVGGMVIPFYSSAVQQQQQQQLSQGNANFNFQSLFTALNYGTQNAPYAINYIKFISGAATPVSNLNLGSYTNSQLSMKQKLKIQTSATYQAYQVQRRQFLAMQSASLSNLYWIYSRRLPIPTIGSNDTPLGVANPSLAQIEDYNATWRTSNQNNWYSQMATASPAVVQRETLFVLAELQTEIHRMRQDQERLILLTAIGQVSGLQTTKQTLQITEKQVQDMINQEVKTNSQQGSSNSTANQNQQNASPQSQNQAEELKQAKESAKTQQKQNQQNNNSSS